MRAAAAVLLAIAAAAPALAQQQGAFAATYACARGVTVPVVYVNGAPGGDVAVLVVEGRQVLLMAEPAASGVRYGWPSDGSSYVWWTKGDGATLLWKDGAAGTEDIVLADCLTE